MTKTLRMKFIVTAMTAVSILLILLIGGINIANFSVNERMTRDFLKVLAENDGSLSDREPPDELKERPADLFRFQENGRQPAPMEYFWAETDGAGMVVSCDVSHMSSFTVKEAEAYIGRIAVLNQPWGRDDGMRYFISESGIGEGESRRRCGYLESIAFGTPRSSSFSGGGSCRLVFYADPYLSSVRPGSPAHRGEYGKTETVCHRRGT